MCKNCRGAPGGQNRDIHLTFAGPRLQRAIGATSRLPSLAPLRCARQLKCQIFRIAAATSLDSPPAFKSRFKAGVSCRKSSVLCGIKDQLVMTSVVLISKGQPSSTSSVNPVSFPNRDLSRRSCDAYSLLPHPKQ